MSRIVLGIVLAIGLVSPVCAEEKDSPYRQQKNVVFAQSHGVAITMDIFTPTGPVNGLGIVDVASGAYHSDRGKIRDHRRARMFDILCARGYTVFAVRPGSVSRFSIEDMVDHIESGIRWVKSQADNYKIDANRLGLLGASAGGHLASLTAVRGGARSTKDNAAVVAVAVFFPLTDFREYGSRTIDPRGSDSLSVTVRALAFPKGTDGLSDDQISAGLDAISPARIVTTNTPPFLLIHGDADPVVPLQQSKKLLRQLQQKGISAKLIVKERGGHPWLTIHEEVAKMADWFDGQFDTHKESAGD